MKRAPLVVILGAIALAPTPALAKKKPAKAHAHGHAKADIGVEGNKIEVELEIPADSIFGFEHVAKTDAEKKIVEDARATLRDKAAEMFVLPADAGCKATKIQVESTLEDDDHGKKKHAHEGHSDVDVEYDFLCDKSPAGLTATFGIMSAFPKLKEIKVQVVSSTGQKGLTVTSAKDPVGL